MSSAITGRHSNAPTTIVRGIETVFIIGFIIYAGLCTCRHDSSTTSAKVLKNNRACQPFPKNIPFPPPPCRTRHTAKHNITCNLNLESAHRNEHPYNHTLGSAPPQHEHPCKLNLESVPPHKTKTGTTLVQDDSHYSYPIRGYSYPIRGLRFAKTILLPEPPSP